MGTIAEKLLAVLDSKNAIRDKFGLAEDLPFSQYAANINTSDDTDGGTTDGESSAADSEFYQCTALQEPSVTTESYHNWYEHWWVHNGNDVKDYDGLYINGKHIDKDYYLVKKSDSVYYISSSDYNFRDVEIGRTLPATRPNSSMCCVRPPACLQKVISGSERYDGVFNLVYYSESTYGYAWERKGESGTQGNSTTYHYIITPDGYFYDNGTKIKIGSEEWTGTVSNFGIVPGVWDFGVVTLYNTGMSPVSSDGDTPTESTEEEGETTEGETTEGETTEGETTEGEGAMYLPEGTPGIYRPYMYDQYGIAVYSNESGSILAYDTKTLIEPPYFDQVEDAEGNISKEFITDGASLMQSGWYIDGDNHFQGLPSISTPHNLYSTEYPTIDREEEDVDFEGNPITVIKKYYDISAGEKVVVASGYIGAYYPTKQASALTSTLGTFTSDDARFFRIKGTNYILTYGEWSVEEGQEILNERSGTSWHISEVVDGIKTVLYIGPQSYYFPWEKRFGAWGYNNYFNRISSMRVNFSQIFVPNRNIVAEKASFSVISGVYRNCGEYFEKKGTDGNSVYLLRENDRWYFSTTFDNTGMLLCQKKTGQSPVSAASVYVSPSDVNSDTVTDTSVYVRFAAESERAYDFQQAGWTGVKAVRGEDGTFTIDPTQQHHFPVSENRNVFPGHIYNSDATVEVAWLNSNIEPLGKYLCNYVNRTYFSYNTIVVSGMPTDAFAGASYTDQQTWESAAVPEDIAARDPNGTYTLTNTEAQYTSQYVWQSENGCVIVYNDMNMCFAIEPGAEYKGTGKIMMSGIGDGSASYPVPEEYNTSYDWMNSSWNTIDGASVVVPNPEAVEQYWNGYRLVRNDDGKWTLDYSESVKLAYSDFMPVVGRVYDTDCTMEIMHPDWADEDLYVTPINMLTNENDEWVISASTEYTDSDVTHYGCMAFDGDSGTFWWEQTGSSTPFLQWVNKLHPVLLKKLEITTVEWIGGPPTDGVDSRTYFEASNDGETWVALPYEKWEHSNNLQTITLPDNSIFYSHYRLRAENNRRWLWHSVVGYRTLELREVPK